MIIEISTLQKLEILMEISGKYWYHKSFKQIDGKIDTCIEYINMFKCRYITQMHLGSVG